MRGRDTPDLFLPSCWLAVSNIFLLSATDFCRDFTSTLLFGVTGDFVPKVCARRARMGSRLEVVKRLDERWLSIEHLSRVSIVP